MSSSRQNKSSSDSNILRHIARIKAQTTIDAKIQAEYEDKGGSSFDYSRSVCVTTNSNSVPGHDQQSKPKSDRVTTAYLHDIQKGKLIQPFGCLLAHDEKTFMVIAYSENAPEMLTMVSHTVPSGGDHPALGIGTDIRTIFTSASASALHKALGFGDVSLLNPILVHYGALQSYELAAKAITRLQSLPSGSMERLCHMVVQEVYELTGYDRVHTYKFHEDDQFGWCCEWNPAMAKLSGWKRDEVIDKMLLGEVFGTNMACCRLKNQETFVNFGVVLNNAMMGEESEKVSFGFLSRNGKYVDCLLCVSKKVDAEGTVTGLFCFMQIASQELQQALHVQRLSEQTAKKRLKALTFIKRQIKNPLSGIIFSSKMMEGTELDDVQKQLLQTSTRCQRQLNKILDETDLESIMDSYLDLEMAEFTLQEVLVTSISQVMIKISGKGIRINNSSSDEIMAERLYGDSLRLQQILSDFLLISVNFTPNGGQLGFAANLTKDQLGESAHLDLKITHSRDGVPEELLSQMFEINISTETVPSVKSDEGINLLVNRKLLKLMNGDVRYLREAGGSSFIISLEVATSALQKTRGSSTTSHC